MKLGTLYKDKLYGGWLGKVVGVIHGANVESWTYEKIKSVFGTISSYPYTFKNFCADDDINGPLFYQRALLDHKDTDHIMENMTETVRNYVADGHGFFWWGGYGISTENTAYENLKRGISAPDSGSIRLNGKTTAEQIGGQIFSDCWGFVCPGDPERAAGLAAQMSSVTHGGEGINGGRFVAACVAAAFEAATVDEIIKAGLNQLPADSHYLSMAQDVLKEARGNGSDWEKTFRFVQDKYGYQHYKGVCHIIPNAAVILLSLVHGKGSFDDTINICNMCGWDTDCNVGNAGAIMGTFVSAQGIGKKWTEQINDFICASSVMGSLNIQTVSQAAEASARIAHKLYGAELDEAFKEILSAPEGRLFHFEFPQATHALRVRGAKTVLENTDEASHSGQRSLKVVVPNLERGESVALYFKSYYTPEDFDDSRYDPDFSPVLYPGDSICAWLKPDTAVSSPIRIVPFWKDRISGHVFTFEENSLLLENDSWTKIAFSLPKCTDVIIEEVGFHLIALAPKRRLESPDMVLYVDDIHMEAHPGYSLCFSQLPMEKWNVLHQTPAHLTRYSGIAELADGELQVSGAEQAEAYTGYFGWENYRLTVRMVPRFGSIHRVLFRVQGAMRAYAVSLQEGVVVLEKKESGLYTALKSVSYPWRHGEEYAVTVMAVGGHLSLSINGESLLAIEDIDNPYTSGCIGFGNEKFSRTSFISYEINSVPDGGNKEK